MLTLLTTTLVTVLASPGAAAPVPSVQERAAPVLTERQVADPLLGAWSAKTGPLRGEVIAFAGDGTCSKGSMKGTWASTAAGSALTVQWPAEAWECGYELSGARLVLTIDGRRSILRRAKAGAPSAPKGPALRPKSEEVQATGFAGTFSGEGASLTLRDAAPGLVGTLSMNGNGLPCRAVSHDGVAFCAVRPAGAKADVVYLLRRDGEAGYRLEGGHSTLRLTRGAGKPSPAAQARPTKRYTDPSGFYSLDLPAGWSVRALTSTELLINPGFKPTDNLDALIVLSVGELEPGDARRTPAQMLDRGESEMRREWRAQGVTLERASSKAKSQRVGSHPAATMQWKGTLANGDPIDAWVGGVAGGGGYLTLSGVIARPRLAEFLPGIQGAFQSLTFTPPKRDPALERQLAGRKLQLTNNSEGNYMVSGIDLYADGTASEFTSMGGSLGLGSAGASYEASGTYVVIGTVLRLTLDGKDTEVPLAVRNGRITGVDKAQSHYRFTQ